MGLEVNKLSQEKAVVADTTVNKTVASNNTIEVFAASGKEIDNEDTFVSKKRKLKTQEEKNFVEAANKAQEKDDLYPSTLVHFLDDNVKSTELRAELDGYVARLNQVTDPADYEKMHTEGKNPLFDKIVEAYIREEIRKSDVVLINLLNQDKTKNFTKRIENLNNGVYMDEAGAEQTREKFPKTSYDEYALQSYSEELLPREMDYEFRQILLKLEEDGKLGELKSKGKLADAMIEVSRERMGGEDELFEEYIIDTAKNRNTKVKVARRHDRVMERREELKQVTLKEIESKLKKSTRESIKDYMEAHKNDDGTYDLSEISELIEKRVGKDFYVNRHDDDDKTIAEIEQVRKELIAKDVADSENFDKKDKRYKQTKDLIKFCEYDRQSRNHVPSGLGMLSGLIGGAAVGGAAHYFASPDIIPVNNTVNVEVLNNVIINGEVTETFTTTANVNQNLAVPLTPDILKAAAIGGATTLALVALEDIIFGRDITYERPCVDTMDYDTNDERYTNKHLYVDYLKKTDEAQYNAVKHILDKYPANEDGNWDHAGFFNELRTTGGTGSPTNCQELTGEKLYSEQPDPVIITSEKKETVDDKDKPIYDTVETPEDCVYSKQARRTSWAHLVTLYDCGTETFLEKCGGDMNKAIRMIKIAQAITDGNYSFERLEDLYQKSRKGASNLKNIDGLDYGTYYSVLMGNIPSSVKLPKELAGAERCDISEDEHELIAAKAKDTENAPKPAQGPAIGKTVSQVETGKFEQKEEDRFGVAEEGKGAQWFNTEHERDSVVGNFKRLHPNVEPIKIKNVEEFENKAKKTEKKDGK